MEQNKPQIDKEQLKKYYQSCKLELLPYSNFRQFKFNIGYVHKVKDTIRTENDLRKNLLKFLPIDAWQTASCFQNPTNVGVKSYTGRKAGFNYGQNMFLYSDMVFDLDSQSVEESFTNLVKVYDFCKGKGWNDIKIIQTNRGYHLWVFDWKNDMKRIENARERENYFKLMKRKTVMEFVGLERYTTFKKVYEMVRSYGIDFATTIDTHRVFRVPYSVHGSGAIMLVMDKPMPRNPQFLTDLGEMTSSSQEEGLVRRIPQSALGRGHSSTPSAIFPQTNLRRA